MYEVSRGVPLLGCLLEDGGANFGIYFDEESSIKLQVYEDYREESPILEFELNKEEHITDHIHHVYISNVKEGMAYCFKVIDAQGNIIENVLDPYAYAIKAYPGKKDCYRGIVIRKENSFYEKPNIPWGKTIIYEMHVGAFTKKDSKNPQAHTRGTFRGIIDKIPYLKELGVTAIELLPIFKWNPNTLRTFHPRSGERLKDFWGYNTIGFFALESKYSSNQEIKGEIHEFKEMVNALHKANIEVILDVVYNHTGEGNEQGKVFNFKALSPSTYYKFDEFGRYRNCSGTGNTFNTQNNVVKKLIIDSLKYWALDMGIDGFRFDLASILGQDETGRWVSPSLLDEIASTPELAHVKLISESWDAKGSYDVGRMPYAFAEWSDYFRDTIRKFIRGDMGLTKSIADCILGKEIYFKDERKNNQHAIHFVTAHDGFTMWDLTSYNEKHNLDNAEDNRDGNNSNYSDNCGVEGETDDPQIIRRRKKRVKNFMCLLMLSRGVPMFVMGDEMCRTQNGNNNAYCQDNETTWVDWNRQSRFQDVWYFTKKLIKIRQSMGFFCDDEGEYHVSWHGVRYGEPDWSYYSRSIAWHIKGDEEEFYAIVNSYHEPLVFEFPPGSERWERLIDTDQESPFDIVTQKGIAFEKNYQVNPYSVCLFKRINKEDQEVKD